MLHTVCYSPEPLITMFVYSFFKHKFKLKIQRKEIINKIKIIGMKIQLLIIKKDTS